MTSFITWCPDVRKRTHSFLHFHHSKLEDDFIKIHANLDIHLRRLLHGVSHLMLRRWVQRFSNSKMDTTSTDGGSEVTKTSVLEGITHVWEPVAQNDCAMLLSREAKRAYPLTVFQISEPTRCEMTWQKSMVLPPGFDSRNRLVSILSSFICPCSHRENHSS